MVLHTNEDKLNMVLIYGESRRNASEVMRLYALQFPNRPLPDHKTLISLCENLRITVASKNKNN